MNFELFVARRIVSKSGANFSRPIIRIAVVSIILGLAVMIVSVAIVTGFQRQIQEKIIGFGSHIQILRYDSNLSLETEPVSTNQEFYPGLTEVDGIRHIQVFGIKAGLLKTEEQIQGVVLKGIGSDYDWSFFKEKLVEGQPVIVNDSTKSDDVLISRNFASKLKLKLGDDIRMYFIIDNITRGRKFKIAGIYETGLEDFDNTFVIGDIKHIQKLNNWEENQVTGFEVIIDDFDRLDELGEYIYNTIGYDLDARSIKHIYPQIFDWLSLQDMNVIIILALMVMVAAITMISTLLILILERTNMIGVLKALGSKNWSVRKIFLYNAMYIIGKGLLWGNIVGIAICLLQKHFGIMKLPQESYYVSVVPINIDILSIVILNIGTLLLCTVILIIPSYIITRITPAKAIRYS